ncbi:MAG: DUF1854 domain-containing protein [Candidatus Poribacteria bacterium]|nr:DUF1854 domain-containing protein [Candidatus Poribacteria bacterium]
MKNENGKKEGTLTTDDTAKPESSEPDDFTPRYLDAAQLTFTRAEVGTARLEIQDEVCHLRVLVRRLMPLSNPDGYISIAADEDTEIGILVNPSELTPESQKILREELDKRYFTPTIQKVYRVKEQFGIHEWEVQTARGRITFSVRGLNQNIKQVPPARLFVTDVQGNRYDIPDYRELDAQSYLQIQRHL